MSAEGSHSGSGDIEIQHKIATLESEVSQYYEDLQVAVNAANFSESEKGMILHMIKPFMDLILKMKEKSPKEEYLAKLTQSSDLLQESIARFKSPKA